jgi:hypothetical protein
MSHAVAIGLDGDSGGTSDVVTRLLGSGFVTLEKEISPSGRIIEEVSEAVYTIRPTYHWYVAVHGEDADLEYIYTLAQECKTGQVKSFADAVQLNNSVKAVGVYIYDLSMPELVIQPPRRLDEMCSALVDEYPIGGPMQSVYHEFTARGSK